MVICSIGNQNIVQCDVAPIVGDTNYVEITKGYPPSYMQYTDDIYRSGLMINGLNQGFYCNIMIYCFFNIYPTNFGSLLGGQQRVYDGENGYYVGYVETGFTLTSNYSLSDINFIGEKTLGAYDDIRNVLLPLISIPYVPVNWQSVPSITGKGKTVQLSTLNDINDGEEVITDDTSKFNLTTASNLITLVSSNLSN